MLILSLETSCDETALALGEMNLESAAKAARNSGAFGVEAGTSGAENFQLLSNTVLSQVKLHQPFGGVVPDLAAREHLKNLKPLLEQTFKEAGEKVKRRGKAGAEDAKNARENNAQKSFDLSAVDAFSVVNQPGLIPALLVGVSAAKTLSFFWEKPLIPIQHVHAHIYAAWLKKDGTLRSDIEFPALALVVSGGHTQLILIKDHFEFEILGTTLDDAAGEAFDKVAKLLELGYPGGPLISQLAKQGDPGKFDLPRPLLNSSDLNFSFSGLKTAVMYLVKAEIEKKKKLNPQFKKDLAAAFESAVVEVLIKKTSKALEKHAPKSLILAGGVAANEKLRAEFQALGKNSKKNQLLNEVKKQARSFEPISVFIPELEFCSDNAAMQLPVVYFKIKKHGLKPYQKVWGKVTAKANG